MAVVAEHFAAGHAGRAGVDILPGTTDEVIRSLLERGGLVAGVDFHLAFSPNGSTRAMRRLDDLVTVHRSGSTNTYRAWAHFSTSTSFASPFVIRDVDETYPYVGAEFAPAKI